METIFLLFVHILILALVFGLLYWVVTLVASLLPAPIATTVRAILLVLLALMAIAFLLGDIGYWGTWGLHHRRW